MSSFITFPREDVGLMICWSCLFRLCMEQAAVSCSSSFCNHYVRFANYLFSLAASCDCIGVTSVQMCRASGQSGHAHLLAGQQFLTRFCPIARSKKVGVYMGWQCNAELLLTMDIGCIGENKSLIGALENCRNCSPLWGAWRAKEKADSQMDSDYPSDRGWSASGHTSSALLWQSWTAAIHFHPPASVPSVYIRQS